MIEKSSPIPPERIELYCSLEELSFRLQTNFVTGLSSNDIKYREKNEIIEEKEYVRIGLFITLRLDKLADFFEGNKSIHLYVACGCCYFFWNCSFRSM